jgi:hypothetical protein
MAAWRLRRLYHAEAAFYTKEMTFLAGLNSEKKLDGQTLTGLAINANRNTVDTFRRQEASLERSFCRALQELKRIRSQRQKDLALVCTIEPAKPQASARGQINNIQPATTDPDLPNPAPDPEPSPENSIHVVPPTDDMQ